MIRYNKKELSKKPKTLLKANSSIYRQAMALEEYLKQEQLKDGNTFLLMASLQWKYRQATKFLEDIISFRTNVLEWFKKALYKAKLVIPVCAWLFEKQAIEDRLPLIFEKCADVFATKKRRKCFKKWKHD